MRPSAPQPPTPGEPKVASLEQAIQFFAAMLLAVLRSALIYSPRHSQFQRALAKAEQMAAIAFDFAPEIVFICLERELFVAGRPMNKRGIQFQRLAEFMDSLGVQRLQLLPGLSAEELRDFALHLLGLSASGERMGRRWVEATAHIRVGRLKDTQPDRAASLASFIARQAEAENGKAPESGSGGDATDEAAFLQAASREMAACEKTLRFIADLAKHARYLALLTSLREHDEPTYLHSINVGLLVAAQATVLQAPPDFFRDLLLAGLFHDIGKLEVPKGALSRTRRRTPDEERMYQTHCRAGAQILIRYPAIPRLAAVVAFEHHVHADGSGGFPQERRSGMPHLASQIVALADFYDTLAAEPPSRPEDILEAIRRETPKRFRPALVAGFPQALLAFEPLTQP